VNTNMVARLGGDEFVVVLRGYEVATNASIVAENIRQSLSKPFQLGSEPNTNNYEHRNRDFS